MHDPIKPYEAVRAEANANLRNYIDEAASLFVLLELLNEEIGWCNGCC